MAQDIPKQFINVHDKPVLIYTLEGFQRHPMIDAIELVCIDGWEEIARAYAKQFNIDKLKWIIKGGGSAQESIRNGVYNLEGKAGKDDIIVIHDGIRPMIDSDVLTDVIKVAGEYGNGKARETALTNEGYSYSEVRKKINELDKIGKEILPTIKDKAGEYWKCLLKLMDL